MPAYHLPSINKIAEALGGDVVNGEALVPGPGHSAEDRSLSIKLDSAAPDRFVVHSFAGDDPIACRDHVRQKLGLPKFERKKNGGNKASKAWTQISEHIYRDQNGAPYLRVRKLIDESGKKQYPQAHWDGKQWINGKPKGPKIPYNLPALIAAPVTATIWFCEGEKDADALIKQSFVATTASEGAAAFWDPTLTQYFRERTVIILPDADKPGRAHSQKVAKAINSVAASVRVLDLYPDRNDGSDVSNWLEDDTAGSKLAKLAKEAPLWEASATDDDTVSAGDASDDELIAELAALPRLAYEKRREEAAERLGVRVSVLDKLIEAARGSEDETKEPSPALYAHWDVEPWAEPVDGGILLRAIKEAIRRFVFMTEDQAVVATLWIVLSWLHEAVVFLTHSPVLFVTSAEKDSGKTTLLKVISFLVKRGLANVSISGPALFRSITKWSPCLVIDEADTALAENEDLRAVINSGWTRGDGVIRCDTDTHEPRLYSTFAPKIVGMKGRNLPDTTLSRSIIITMKPKRPDDPAEHVEDFNHLDNETFARLRSQLLRWTTDNAEALAKIEPEIPPGFFNRRRANWKPLLAIAEVCGWKAAAWKAALAIEAVADTFDPSIGVQLLRAIKALEARGKDRITSAELVVDLTADETGPWATYNKRRPISQRQIAKLLEPHLVTPHGPKPGSIRLDDGTTAKGYLFAWLRDAFDRFCPPDTSCAGKKPSSIRHNGTDLFSEDFSPFSSGTSFSAVPDKSPQNQRCAGVPDENRVSAGTEGIEASDTPTAPFELWAEGMATDADDPDPEDRTCRQCHRDPPDGKERLVSIQGQQVRLHAECQRFYVQALDQERDLPW